MKYTLQELRKKAKMNEADTGAYINRTRQTYNNIERGKSSICSFQLEKLASLFGVDVNDIDISKLNYRELKKPYKLSDLRKAGIVQGHNIVYLTEPPTGNETFSQKLYDLENGRAKIYTNELTQILRGTGIDVSDIDISTLWLVEYLGNGKIGKTLNRPNVVK